MIRSNVLGLIGALTLTATSAFGAALVREASGAAASDITPARDAFRADLGGGTTAGANGSFGGLRREINWDGTPDASSSPNSLAADFFNSTSPRGAVFSTPGTSFQVSANTASTVAVRFGNINPPYTTELGAFSGERIFSQIGSNVMDVDFFEAGTSNPATVSGFGAVFTDVDLSASASIEYFDANGASLGLFRVPGTAGTASFSFLGVSFDAGERVARVRLTVGTAALANGVVDTASIDVAAMDDFLFSEPAARSVPVNPVVVSPNGGETLTIGATQSITWTPALSGGTVKIELSRNGGASFEPIVASTPDDGAHSFTVSAPPTTQALIRITSLDDITKTDSSNSAFGIAAATADLTASLNTLRLRNGKTVSGNVVLTNGGQAGAGAFTVDVYASTDSAIGSGDTLLGRASVSSLAAGASTTVAFTGRLQTAKARRSINVIALADSTGAVSESSESNNSASGTASN